MNDLNPPVPTQPIPMIPSVHRGNGMHKAVVALVVVAGVVGAYVALANWQSLWPFATQTPTASPTPSVTPSPVAGWKTYTNSQYGFTMQYPATWTVEQNSFSQTSFTSPDTKAAADRNTKDCNDGKDATPCNPEQIAVDAVFSPESLEVASGTEKQVTFNGISFTEYEAVSLYGEKHYKTTHGGATYDFTGYGKPILNQMLATLTFTNSNTTVGWKTYSTTKYGFEVQYPAAGKVTGSLDASDSATIFPDAKNLLPQAGIGLLVQPLGATVGEAGEQWQATTLGGRTATKTARSSEIGDPFIVFVIEIGQGKELAITVPGRPSPSVYDQILSTFRFTSDPTAGWKSFSSQYFTLSLKVPVAFTVQETQDSITIGSSDPNGPSVDLQRYRGVYTKASAQSDFRASHSGVISSTVVVDGVSFTRLQGVSVDALRTQALVLFEKSSLLLSSDTASQARTDLSIPNQILSTFQFSK